MRPDPDGGTFLALGHPGVLAVIARAVRSERPPHALLLAGSHGIGKTTLALDLAAGLLCLAQDPAMRPCRDCAACRKVAAGNHPDLHLVEPEGAGEQIRIGQVQELISALSLMAMEGRFRVAVIAAAHRLNLDAQNALLKTLEEPGVATCLVLCADDTAALLPTVISRAVRLRMAPLAIPVLASLLTERFGVDPSRARGLALAAGGRPGIAITLAGRPEALLARARIDRTLLSLLAADLRTRLDAVGALVADAALVDAAMRGTVASTAARLEPQDRRRAAQVVIEAWRDLGRDLAIAARGGLRAIRDLDQLEELQSAAVIIDSDQLLAFLDRLDRLMLAVEAYANPELVLDHLLLSWPRAAATTGAAPATATGAPRPAAPRPGASVGT